MGPCITFAPTFWSTSLRCGYRMWTSSPCRYCKHTCGSKGCVDQLVVGWRQHGLRRSQFLSYYCASNECQRWHRFSGWSLGILALLGNRCKRYCHEKGCKTISTAGTWRTGVCAFDNPDPNPNPNPHGFLTELHVLHVDLHQRIIHGFLAYLHVLHVDLHVLHVDLHKLLHMYVSYSQTCVGLVLDVIESRARTGIKCRIGNEVMVLFPRLGAMSIDSPERVKYFGMTGFHSCGICRLRKGRSVTRRATRHNPTQISRLYDDATADVRTRPLQRIRKRKRQQLSRWGFDFTKRCRLTDHANRCLVHIPEFQPTLFGGCVRYEAMHIYFIGYCGWLLETLVQCVPGSMRTYVGKIVKQCHHFRDPRTGTTHPRLSSILKLKHYTAEKRVRAVFYWAHVLGNNATIMPQRIRLHCQCAVSSLQLLLIATRGHRSYTVDELRTIYEGFGRMFFTHLETITEYLTQKKFDEKQRKHDEDPENNDAPTPWQREKRSVQVRL